MDGTAAPVDETVLETLRERARIHSLIEGTQVERTGDTVSMVRAEFDLGRYPTQVQDARLEIQWYTNDDYNFHYIETQSTDEIWQCRWDRHPNPHTTRTHFHPPPDARSADAISDSPADCHPSALFTRTLANIRQRIDDLWEDPDF